MKPNNRKQSSSSESLQQTPINKKNDEKPPSVRSSERSIDNEDTTIVKNKDSNNKLDDDDDDEDDEENEYNNIFRKKDTSNKNDVDASSSRPKTRRGLEDSLDKVNEQVAQSNKPPANNDVWRPSSALNGQEPVDPLIGLDDLQDQTARSNEQKKSKYFFHRQRPINLKLILKNGIPKMMRTMMRKMIKTISFFSSVIYTFILF